MSTITKEQAQKIIEAADEVITALAGTNEDVHPEDSRKMCDLWDDLNDRYAPPEVVRELARIALASLEARPAIHRWRRVTVEPYGPYPWHYSNFIGFSKPVEGIEDEYYYSAPPAPVSMKDHQIRDLVNELRDIAVEYYGTQQLRERIAKTVRAAMLQGAEPVTTAYKLRYAVETIRNSGIEINAEKIFAERDALNSPVIPDGWVACSERMPETMVSVLVTGTWFHHSVAFWDGLSWCDLDFEQPVTHWMPLPAAPQQEA